MKKYKKDQPVSYAIGVYPTLELLNTRPQIVSRVLLGSKGDRNEGVKKITQICTQRGIRTEFADHVIQSLSESENTYAVGVFRKYLSPIKPGNHLVLVNPSDKGNLGTIIRTMLAFDIQNLAIIRPSPDVFDPKVVRSAMGAVFKIHFSYFDNFGMYQAQYSNNCYPFMTNGKLPLPQVNFVEPFSLIFGNEGAGLSKEYLSVGTSVSIPQTSSVDSLNLSVAVGLGLYGARRMIE